MQAKCQFNPSSVPVAAGDTSVFNFLISVASGTKNGSYSGKIEASDGLLIYDLPITLNIGGFSMGISPTAIQMLPTDIASATLTLSSIFSYDQSVNLSCSAPTGIVCAAPLSVNPAPGGAQVPLGLQTQAVAAGNYQIAVSGTSTPLSHSASAQLQIWDFNASVTPASATLKAGSSANFDVNIDSLNAFSGAVNLNCSTSTVGITCAFNPPIVTVTAGNTTTAGLTISVAPGLAVNNKYKPGFLYPVWACGFIAALLLYSGKNDARLSAR